MPVNSAAWLVATRAPLEVKAAPYPAPGRGEVVIRARAVAINPVDWSLQILGKGIFPWIKLPMVLGEDLAGEIVEVGEGATRFALGDRVLGHAVGLNKNRNKSAQCAFQLYVAVPEHMVAPIPPELPFENAAVLPLGLSTAACGLFQKDFLALRYPSAEAEPTGRTLLIWGGATSVGCNAIQLAVAAGYEVFATASSKNFAYLKGLGASQVFDYHSRTVVDEIILALRGRVIAGALAIATGSTGACLDIVHACDGAKFVAVAGAPVSLAELGSGGLFKLLRLMPRMLISSLSTAFKSKRYKVPTKFIFGSSLADNEVGSAMYVDFLPGALAAHRYVAAPPVLMAGTGLQTIQEAFDIQRQGVSAQKIVVSL